jgi:hypothetical protein
MSQRGKVSMTFECLFVFDYNFSTRDSAQKEQNKIDPDPEYGIPLPIVGFVGLLSILLQLHSYLYYCNIYPISQTNRKEQQDYLSKVGIFRCLRLIGRSAPIL